MRIVAPDKSVIGAVASGSADAEWVVTDLTNGAPEDAVQFTGNPTWTITPAIPLMIDTVAVINHNIAEAATITLGGGLVSAGTIPTAVWRRDGIPANWFRRITTPVSVGAFTLAVTGNGARTVIGEIYAGLSFNLRDFLHDREFDPGSPFDWEGESSGVPPYDPRISKPRRYRGTTVLNDSDFEELEGIDLSTRRGSLPVLVIMDDSKNDALLAKITYTETHREGSHVVTLEILGIPSVEWA